MSHQQQVEEAEGVVGPDGEKPKVLRPGKPCPFCATRGIRSVAEAQFGGGAICMRCGNESGGPDG